jgi:hypothetical protein
MTRRPARALTALVLTSAVVAASAGTASAERWWGGDRSGDVQQVGFSPEPPPCGTVRQSAAPQDAATDIVGLSVRHEEDTVDVRVQFRDLTPLWGDRRLTLDLETDRRDYQITIQRWRERGPLETTVAIAPRAPEEVDECGTYYTVQLIVPCPDLLMTRSPDREVVSIILPRTCVGGPRWVRAGARNYRTVQDRFRSDVWGTSGLDPVAYTGPFGTRVRHD